ncbi:eukaryotic translation initiation factor 4E-2-like [Silene latifolia]|uniref:eukaryotic translation initiation factor 4E-2-like n=1 Tax=Silene latifolia TaxID=37657 RepID=UPI003D781C10
MGVEETTQKSTTSRQQQEEMAQNEKFEGDVEEGEIIDDCENDENNTNSLNENLEKMTISHPLENSWTFWFDNPSGKSKQAAWGSSMRPVYTFSTVEQFWGVYNNIHHPSKLGIGSDLYCFNKKIEPKWEDPICANGGKWTAVYSRGKSDTSWLYTLLAMIGEQFDHGDEICGAVVNVRNKQDKISIWTKNAANEAAQLSIGRQWKKFMDYSDNMGFIVHDDAKKLDRGAKNRYNC